MAITMTPAAEQHVIKHLEHRAKGLGIRLGVRTTGCSGLSYVLEFVDDAASEDEVFQCGDVKLIIDPKSLLPLRVDFFERNADQPSKRLLVIKREQVQGYWTVMDSTLTDLASGHQTRLTVGRVLYDRNLPESLFTSRALAEERMEKEFRP